MTRLARWTTAAAWIAIPFLLAIFYAMMAFNLCDLFNDAQAEPALVPAIALARGIAIYNSPGEGPATLAPGGPVAHLVRLPAAFGDTPQAVLLIGFMLNLILFFAPFKALTYCMIRRRPGSKLYAFHAALAFGFIGLTQQVPLGGSAWLDPNAPAIFFAGLALAALLFNDAPAPNRAIVACAALLAWLAFWSDPVFAVVLPLLLLHARIIWGHQGARRMAAALLIAGIAVALPIVLYFGARGLWWNLVALPLRGWWAGDAPLGDLLQSLGNFARFGQPILLLAGVAFFAGWRGGSQRSFAQWLRANPEGLLLLTGCALIPFAVLKSGNAEGACSSYVPPLYFLMSFALLGMPRLFARHENETANTPVPDPKTTLRLLGLALAFITAFSVAPLTLYIPHMDQAWEKTHETDLARECAYIEDHAGRVYFPASPLAHLLAERKLYLSTDALAARDRAGLPVTPEEFARIAPANVELILLPPSKDHAADRDRWIPADFENAANSAFKGWRCYRKQGTPAH